MESLAYATNHAHQLLDDLDRALESGLIDESTWYEKAARVITPVYLVGENPRAQSGYSGDDLQWNQARSLIADAIDRSGTFLDVGCASGYLMESIERWCRRKGLIIQPHGLDIAPELADLARRRLPYLKNRICCGNAMNWRPHMKFNFVRTGLEYVPNRRQRDLIDHLLNHAVAPGGRLIIGTYNETRSEPAIEQCVASWGYSIVGRSERAHRDPRLSYRVIWLDSNP